MFAVYGWREQCDCCSLVINKVLTPTGTLIQWMQVHWCLFFYGPLKSWVYYYYLWKITLQDSTRTRLNVFSCNEICWKIMLSLSTRNLIQMPFKNQWMFDFNMLLIRPQCITYLKLGASQTPLKAGTLFRKWPKTKFVGSNFY